MNNEIQMLLDQYWSWLKDRTTIRDINDTVEITTPFLDRHNDYIQIYVQRLDDEYVLTDDRYIIEDLEMSGCKIDSNKRKELLNTTLNGFGVHVKDNELKIRANKNNFALHKHNLVQAMLAVNDLFYLSTTKTESFFKENVANWLDESNIRYTPGVKFTGSSGYDHRFDFVIPKSRIQPERVLRAINQPNRNATQAMVFSWDDTKIVRSSNSRAYAFLNDSDQLVSENLLTAMRIYEINPVLWSGRDTIREELAA